MSRRHIKYVLRWPDRGEQILVVVVEDATQEIILNDEAPPAWARLDNAKCRHCPLDSTRHPYCPLARALVDPLRLCAHAQGKDQIEVDVVIDDRVVSTTTTVQRAMSSLLGLIMPSSGCPHTEFLRPMARFHLPFASPTETLYRSTSMYLLGQHFRERAGQTPDYALTGLQRRYRQLHTLNRDFAKRLRHAAEGDAAFNAVVFLDLFTIALPQALEEALEPIASLFESFTREPPADQT